MLYGFISILGIFIGFFIAKYSNDEFKQGRIYFKILELILLIILTIISIKYNFNYLLFIFGLILGFIIRYEYFYFGIFIVNIKNLNYNFLVSSLIFLYSLPFGTLLFNKFKIKDLTLQIILFLITILLILFEFDLISLASGSLVSISLLKIHSLLNFKFKH